MRILVTAVFEQLVYHCTCIDERDPAMVPGVGGRVGGGGGAQVGGLRAAGGRPPADARVRAEAQSAEAGVAAARRIVAELRALFSVDPVQQPATPLEVVRTAFREPTAVLAEAGVPPIVRDEFDERAWPDDIYGLVPRTLGDLGDPELAPLHLAWGVAKATVVRARRAV